MILVTGGNGFVGRAVVKELLRQGHKVRVVSRHARSLKKNPMFSSVECVEADVAEADAASKAMRGIKAVLHLVGVMAPLGKNSLEAAHIRATEKVIRAMKENGVWRLIHMSALGTRPHAVSCYHQTKWEAEELVKNSGLDWTIFRPSLIYGQGNKVLEQFASLMRFPSNPSGCVPCLGNGKTLFQPIAVEEVAYCFSRALTREVTLEKIYDLCGQQAVSFREILVKISQAQGFHSTWLEAFPALYGILIPWKYLTSPKPILVAIPFELSYGIAAIAGKFFPQLGLATDGIKMLEEANIGEGEQAWRDFDFVPVDFSIGIRKIFQRA